ncbi:MAG: nitroreductase, partial [Selenomonas sp.]|nr:nitroreductase [Selenomonas sp.]
KLKELFPVMEGYNLIASFPVGYPTEKGVPSPRHKERKSAVDIVQVL